MVKARKEQYKKRFEATYGPGTWREFTRLVYQQVRPQVIRSGFLSKGRRLEMSRPSFSIWESRAREIRE